MLAELVDFLQWGDSWVRWGGSYFVWWLGVERNKGVMGGMGVKDIVLISASGDLKRVGGSIILGLCEGAFVLFGWFY